MNCIIFAMCLWQLTVGVLGNDVKRFGPGNGFMCHCKTKEQCDKTSGQCASGCATAWFGPGCQYRDLGQMKDRVVSQTLDPNGSEAIKAVDGDVNTCSSVTGHANPHWKIRFPHNETITEMYIQTKTTQLRHFGHIRVFVEYDLTNNIEESEKCFSDDNIPSQNTSFKIKCVAPTTGNQVRIELGLKDEQSTFVLCDIRINGGRNLAFDKSTDQSTTLYDNDSYNSSKAVDGNMQTCSWTKATGNKHWRLILSHAAILQHIKFTTESGQAYKAELYDSNTNLHTWEDQNGDSSHTINKEATRIIIRQEASHSLTMCEVELFGDCTKNYCGLDCKTECKCDDMSIWDRISANCSSGQRKDVPHKKDCDDGYYGTSCRRCGYCINNQPCDKTTGKCPGGCQAGYEGELCSNSCKDGMYGDQCLSSCSEYCQEYSCNKVTGHCIGDCKDGWHGDMCNEVCEAGKWGPGCAHACGNCSNGTVCDKISGVCSEGCSIGFTGELCIQAPAKQELTETTLFRVLVGVLSVVVVVALVLIALFVHRRKRRKRSTANSENVVVENKAGPSNTNAISLSAEDEPNVEIPRPKYGVKISELLQYVKQSLSDNDKLISEFQTIPYGLQYPTEQASLPSNVGKNRYKDVYPYDNSRVILSTLPGLPNSDYINASHIRGHARENAYIAAQGPVDSGLEDFWRMIWEKGVRTIAMLTNLIEEMKVKCFQYWSDPGLVNTYGNVTVSNESEDIFAEFTIRRFKVFQQNDRGNERTVIQFQYTAWPDKGVPRSTSSLVHFLHVVRQTDSCKSHTWLVHCSAGVGRTGTFIAMDILYDEGEDLGTVDVHRCVQTLREQRVNMVQTKEQYKFLHGLVLELLFLPSRQTHRDDFSVNFASLQSVDSKTGKTRLMLEYEGLQDETPLMNLLYESCKLQSSIDDEDRFVAAKLDANRTKNRHQNVLAANEFRPFLSTNIPGCTNYINAVYIQSYCNKQRFILTQIPMKETAVDCCRLVIEERVKVIVTFEHKVKDEEDVGEYLPEDGSIQLGPFKCTKVAETDENTYLVRTHRFVYNSEETTVHQFIFKNWPTNLNVPPNPSTILNFLQVVELTNRKETGNAIIVQCLNGAERSGLFVALMNIMEHFRYDNEVSIPQLVRCARIRREQIIPNFEQYKFCYDVVSSYVENNPTYANM